MGGAVNKPEYSGIHKYPGWLATIITVIVGGVFVGALVWTGSHGHHGEEHGEAHGAEHHEEASGAEHKEDAHK